MGTKSVDLGALTRGLTDGEQAELGMALHGAHTDRKGHASAAEVEGLVAGTRVAPAVLAAIDPDAIPDDGLDERF